MGVHAKCNNKKRTALQKNPNKVHRLRRAERKRRLGTEQGEVTDIGLLTPHLLKKRRTNLRANITLSGKKKRKILKQLRRINKAGNEMEVVVSAKSVTLPKVDIEMRDGEADATTLQQTNEDVEMKEVAKRGRSRTRKGKRSSASKSSNLTDSKMEES